jgi:hypothetical protein
VVGGFFLNNAKLDLPAAPIGVVARDNLSGMHHNGD